MNINLVLILAVLVAALAAPGGYGQDAGSASLQAESDNSRLFLVGKNLTWEQVQGFGLIVEYRSVVEVNAMKLSNVLDEVKAEVVARALGGRLSNLRRHGNNGYEVQG